MIVADMDRIPGPEALPSFRREDLRVLIVEDDKFLRKALELFLEEAGFCGRSAENGRSALDEADRLVPDLILLDIEMPIMDGRSFARSYQRKLGKDAAVILCTTGTEDPLALPSICDEVLGKPFDLEGLVNRILIRLQ
jgi:two-component system, chemotaxis family, chemotaxis protein CheY